MILQADETRVLSRPSIRIDRAGMFWRHGLTFREVRDRYVVQGNDRVWPVNCDVHRVPFADRFDRAR